jgi:hypothetical protein
MGVRRYDVQRPGDPCERIALEHLADPETALFGMLRIKVKGESSNQKEVRPEAKN